MLTTRVPRDWRKQLARPRVLVIDDDDDVADVLRLALSEEGYAVATVPHGAAALDILKLHEPDVILLDLRMPLMDGWSFAERYRAVTGRAPAPIILISGVSDIEAEAKRVGADSYFRKPFDIDELVRAIERARAAC
jgi:CheY-like chemotaxis protein